MAALYLTIFISLILAIIFLVLFYHSNKTGQYEDTYTPSVRMLFEDEAGYKSVEEKQRESEENTPK